MKAVRDDFAPFLELHAKAALLTCKNLRTLLSG
jgi:hypothetical protein